jgi:DnaB-like helicase C terminal domain
MSEMIDKEYETFFPLLHAILRDTAAADLEKENQRARDVMMWGMGDTVGKLAVVLDPDEKRLMIHILDYWRDYQQGPSRRSLEDMVRADDFPEAQVALLEAYDTFQPQCAVIDPLEVPALFKTREESWARQMFLHVTYQGRLIAQGEQPASDWKEAPKKGVKDAIQYLDKELHSAAFNLGVDINGGPIRDLASEVVGLYRQNVQARKSNTLTIKTGIPLIDDVIGGYDRKTLNLILGTVGQRKSAVARTIAYYAAVNGFRVLFLCLEWPWQEEVQIFAMMHAHSDQFLGTESFSIENFRNGMLAEDEVQFLESDIVVGFRQRLNTKLVIRGIPDRSWPNVRSVIQAENAIEKLDMVVIDYITLLDPMPPGSGAPRGGNTTDAMNQIIREIKHMALFFDDGRGLVFVSPVQGNRNGYEAAVANQGAWEATAIYQYSELEKSADTVLYTFMPDDLKADNKMRIGFCKTRRHGTTVPQTVTVDPQVGLVGGSSQTKERLEKEARDMGWSGGARRGPDCKKDKHLVGPDDF